MFWDHFIKRILRFSLVLSEAEILSEVDKWIIHFRAHLAALSTAKHFSHRKAISVFKKKWHRLFKELWKNIWKINEKNTVFYSLCRPVPCSNYLIILKKSDNSYQGNNFNSVPYTKQHDWRLSYLCSSSSLVMAGRNLSKWIYPVWSSSTWLNRTRLLGFGSWTSPNFSN